MMTENNKQAQHLGFPDSRRELTLALTLIGSLVHFMIQCVMGPIMQTIKILLTTV